MPNPSRLWSKLLSVLVSSILVSNCYLLTILTSIFLLRILHKISYKKFFSTLIKAGSKDAYEMLDQISDKEWILDFNDKYVECCRN